MENFQLAFCYCDICNSDAHKVCVLLVDAQVCAACLDKAAAKLREANENRGPQ